jgi:hypothetical protein
MLPSLEELPTELLTQILNYLWEPGPRGSLRSIRPLSRVCKHLRRATLPLLFREVSCWVRESRREYHHVAFGNIADHPYLLQYIQTLCVRLPYEMPREAQPPPHQGVAEADLQVIKQSIRGMTALQQIR